MCFSTGKFTLFSHSLSKKNKPTKIAQLMNINTWRMKEINEKINDVNYFKISLFSIGYFNMTSA
jgi:hypothetical protein